MDNKPSSLHTMVDDLIGTHSLATAITPVFTEEDQLRNKILDLLNSIGKG